MNIKEVIESRILKLKSKPLSVESKLEIQKLQQMLDEPNETASENLNKTNSAKNSRDTQRDIEGYLYNKENRE